MFMSFRDNAMTLARLNLMPRRSIHAGRMPEKQSTSRSQGGNGFDLRVELARISALKLRATLRT